MPEDPTQLKQELLDIARRIETVLGDSRVVPDRSKSPGQRLVLARSAAGLSQVALAQMAGVSPNTIINIETGKSNPRPQTWMRIATVLNVPWEDLAGEE